MVHSFLRQHEVSWGEFIGIGSGRWRKAAWQGLLIGWGALPPALSLKALMAQAMTWVSLTPKDQIPVEILQKTTDWQPFLGIGLTALIMAPLVEEILFRGILYVFFKQRGFAAAGAWISALLFATFHFNQVSFVPLVFLALCLVWIYDYTGSLMAPILAHAFFNGVNFLGHLGIAFQLVDDALLLSRRRDRTRQEPRRRPGRGQTDPAAHPRHAPRHPGAGRADPPGHRGRRHPQTRPDPGRD